MLRRVAAISVGLTLLPGLVASIYKARYSAFDPDEFQHTHIAWGLAEGRLLYRDIYDHHGPIYAFLNGALFHMVGGPPSFDLVYLLRAESVVWFGVVVALTGWLAHRMGARDPLLAWGSAAFVATIACESSKSVEIRPDGLQAALWLGALSLIANDRRSRSAWLAGVLLALTMLTNTKAGVAIFAFLMPFFALEWGRVGKTVAARRLVGLLTAAALTISVPCVYFQSEHALGTFLEATVWSNVHLYGSRVLVNPVPALFAGVFRDNPLLIALCAYGSWHTLTHMRRAPPSIERSMVLSAFAATSIAGAFGYFGKLYGQHFLSLFPLMVAVATAAVAPSFARWPRAACIVMTLVLGMNAATSLRSIDGDDGTLAAERLTEHVLSTVPRSEPVVTFWGACGGFMFNADLQPIWYRLPATYSRGHNDALDAQNFGPAFIARLREQRPRYLVGTRSELLDLRPETIRAIRTMYERKDDCLLERRTQ